MINVTIIHIIQSMTSIVDAMTGRRHRNHILQLWLSSDHEASLSRHAVISYIAGAAPTIFPISFFIRIYPKYNYFKVVYVDPAHARLYKY